MCPTKARSATFSAVLALLVLFSSPSWGAWLPDGNVVSDAPRRQWWPAVVPDGSGGVVVAWEDSRTPEYGIYAQRINADGETIWAAGGVRLVVDPSIGERPAMASDGAGGAFVAWVDNTVLDGRKVFVQWVDSAGTIRWGDDALQLTTGVSWEYDPKIVADGAGGAIVAWRVYEDGIYVQRIDASGTRVWTTNGVDLTPGPGECSDPVLVQSSIGGAIIAWHSTDIYAQRVDASGTVKWAAGGVPVCVLADDQRDPKIIGLDDGGAIIVWKDGRGDDFDIYAQRITVAAGAPVWAVNGVPVCGEPGRQQRPVLVTDTEDGAIVAWEDNRSDDGDIYCQRLNSLGLTEWAPGGLELCTVAEWQERPEIAVDEAGGAIITWQDRRSGVFDVYSQRVDASGTTMWWDQGTPVCTYSNGQTFPVVASDGAGGGYFAWMDERTDHSDIYAQRVNMYGCPAMPECCVGPDVLDFGTLDVGSSDDLAFSITNSSDVSISGDITETCDHYGIVSGGGPYALAPGGTLPVTVRFEPLYPGVHDCVVETGSPQCGPMACTGVAVGTPSCTLVPSSLNFGQLHVGEKGELNFIVVNEGTTILSGTIQESCGHYRIASGGGPYTLYPGESRVVTVWFEPYEKGVHTCVIETGSDTCPDLPCTGKGMGPLPNNNGKWALHFAGDHNSKINTCYFDPLGCLNLVVDAPAGAGRYDVYVIAIDVDAIAGTRYGLECDGPFYFYGWTNCGILEIPTPGWPGCGEGNAQAWAKEQPGPHAVVGILDVYTYTGSVSLSTCPDPRVHFAEWCNGGVPNPICAKTTYPAAFGSIGFGVPGFNPCSMIPVGLAAIDINATEKGILLEWEAGAGGIFDSFFVRRSAADRDGIYPRLHEKAILSGAGGGSCYSYLDEEVIPGTLYYYKIEAVGPDGGGVFFGPYAAVAVERVVTNRLSQNVPNPFSRGGNTAIHFTLGENADVKIRIFDAAGRLMRAVEHRARRGDNWITWNGVDRNGRRVAAGIYFYEIQAPGFSAERKMMVVD
jgi:hypothetical protein